MAQFIISIAALRRNTTILREVKEAAGCKLVLALKGFSCWKAFPFIKDDLDGCCASGIWEARLANEHFGKAVITYSPAYSEDDVARLLEFTTHLDFNSLGQWMRFRETILAHPRFKSGELHCGLRINPEHSTGETPLYDPCVPGSRLGITAEQLDEADLTGISGLHFHTLCEQNSDDLESTLAAVDEKFGHLLRSPKFTYLNMGGGHWITKPDYDRERLIRLVRETREKYGLEVWLEPGEAIAIHTGVLRCEVVDVFESMGHRHAILDISATGHMPDVLEMPYRPDVFLKDKEHRRLACVASPPQPETTLHPPIAPEAPSQSDNHNISSNSTQTGRLCSLAPAVTLKGESYQKAGTPDSSIPNSQSPISYRLGCPTCLAGDVIGDYSFPRELIPGDTLIFDDMAHYTMVKTTTFNGVKHPDIVLLHTDGRLETIREFAYEDFRDRLG